MSIDNKPEDVADSDATEEVSQEQVIHERVTEALRANEEKTNLNPQSKKEGEADVTTQGGSSNGDNTEIAALKVIEASTGRKFESIEDFNKHYAGLNNLVGDQEVAKARKALETIQKWEKQFGKQTPELERVLADIALSTKTPTPKVEEQTQVQSQSEAKPQSVVSKTDNELTRRLERLEYATQLNELDKKYPEAAFMADVISAVAKERNVTLVEAFEGDARLKQLIDLKTKEESQRSPVVAPSNRTKLDTQKVERLGQKILAHRASEKEMEQFVQEVLGPDHFTLK